MRFGSCSQFAPTAIAPRSVIALAHSAGVLSSLHLLIRGRKLIVATAGTPAVGRAFESDLHLREMKKTFRG
jgi:hypothetical protein